MPHRLKNQLKRREIVGKFLILSNFLAEDDRVVDFEIKEDKLGELVVIRKVRTHSVPWSSTSLFGMGRGQQKIFFNRAGRAGRNFFRAGRDGLLFFYNGTGRMG